VAPRYEIQPKTRLEVFDEDVFDDDAGGLACCTGGKAQVSLSQSLDSDFISCLHA